MNSPVVSISSRVSLRSVGNSMIESAFARVAPEIRLLTIDTVQWTAPGNYPWRAGMELGATTLGMMLKILLAPEKENGAGAQAVVTGYLPNREQTESVLEQILAREHPLTIVDPVMGDHGRLYINMNAAEALRDELAPKADYLLPNLTEARFLAGAALGAGNAEDLLPALHRRFPHCRGIVITSVPFEGNKIGILSSDGKTIRSVHGPQIDKVLYGAGDLYTGLVSALRIANPSEDFHNLAERAHVELRKIL